MLLSSVKAFIQLYRGISFSWNQWLLKDIRNYKDKNKCFENRDIFFASPFGSLNYWWKLLVPRHIGTIRDKMTQLFRRNRNSRASQNLKNKFAKV